MKKLLLSLFLMSAATLSAQVNRYYENHIFTGMLNGKIPVEIAYQTNGKGLMAGYIYYPKAETPAPILIVGHEGQVNHRAPNSENLYKVHFTEYQPDGTITGKITLNFTEVEGDYEFVSGNWTNPGTGKVLAIRNGRSSFQLPAWFVKTPDVLDAPDRSAYSFRHKFVKDKDGWLQQIHVEGWANGKLTNLVADYDLSGAFEKYQEENLTWVTEEDINFDGIPDVMVFIGLIGRGMTQSNYSAWVWNPDTRSFFEVENFNDLAEPEINATAKTITSSIRDVDGLYIDTYKWDKGKLVKVKTRKERIPLD